MITGTNQSREQGLPPAPRRSDPFEKLMLGIRERGGERVEVEVKKLISGYTPKDQDTAGIIALAEFVQKDLQETGGRGIHILHLKRYDLEAFLPEATSGYGHGYLSGLCSGPNDIQVGKMRMNLSSSGRVSEQQLVSEFDPILKSLLRGDEIRDTESFSPLRPILVRVSKDPDQFKLYVEDFKKRFAGCNGWRNASVYADLSALEDLVCNYASVHHGRVLPYPEVHKCTLPEGKMYNRYLVWCRKQGLQEDLPTFADFSRIADLLRREYWVPDNKRDDLHREFPCLYEAISIAELYPRNRAEFQHLERILRTARDPDRNNWRNTPDDMETYLCQRIAASYNDGKSSFDDLAYECRLKLQLVGDMTNTEKLVLQRGYASTPEQATAIGALLLKLYQPKRHGSLEQFALNALPATDKKEPIPPASLEAVLGVFAENPGSLRHPKYATVLRLVAHFGEQPSQSLQKFVRDTILRYGRNPGKCAYFLSQTIEDLRQMHQDSFASNLKFDWWVNQAPDIAEKYVEARTNAEMSLDPYWLARVGQVFRSLVGEWGARP